jgi:signal transduction histidine kinase
VKSSYPKNISIVAVIFIVLILFLAIANFIISIQFRNEFIDYDKTKIASVAMMSGTIIEEYNLSERTSLLRYLASSFGLDHLVITDTLGNRLFDSRLPAVEISTVRPVDFSEEFQHVPEPGEVVHVRDRFLTRHESPPLYVYCALLYSYTSAFDSIFTWHIFYLTISLLFICFLGIFLIRNLFLPMRHVARLARDMGVEMHREDFVSETFDEMYKSMKAKEEALIEFSAYIAHEFRNSIGAISGLARLVEKGKKPASAIVRECHSMEELIQKLLQYSMPLRLTKTPVHIAQLIDEVLNRLDIPSRISVETQIEGEIPVFYADNDLLSLALTNGIHNSVDAMAGKGLLRLEVCREDDLVMIKIADTGSGIPDDELDRVFSPFYTSKEKGMGLGLAYMKKIVEMHNGHAIMESIKGKGTTLIIKLPVV